MGEPKPVIVLFECEDCDCEYEGHALEMTPHLCATCEAQREDDYYEQLDAENDDG